MRYWIRALTSIFRPLSIKPIIIFLPVFYFLLGIVYAQNQGVIIKWNRNLESDIAGYKVYYGKFSRVYSYCVKLSKVTEYTIATMQDTGIFYFAVTAYDSAGNESIYSEEVSIRIVNNGSPPFFSLMSNYPNPFNPETRIPYALSKRLFITLGVYDILGREVKILDQGIKKPGKYEVKWDGKNQYSIPVANGIYFYRLLTGDFCQTRKLILMR